MIVHIVPILEDNYCYVIQNEMEACIIDPGEAKPVFDFLETHNLTPTLIINTHHHWDHVNGNPALVKKYNCPVIAPDQMTDDLVWNTHHFQIIRTPGHTLDHVCLYNDDNKVLFSGDTLFSLGCGRLFEGTADQMFASFQKLKSLPDNTLVYCGHEYTKSNGSFALHVDPDNSDLQQRMDDVEKLRRHGRATIPFNLGKDKRANPFMRAKTTEVFSNLRAQKDKF